MYMLVCNTREAHDHHYTCSIGSDYVVPHNYKDHEATLLL